MPPAATSALPRRAFAGLALAAMLVLGGGSASWAQDPTATTVPPTSDVLIPGTTVAPASTPPSSTSTTAAPEEEDEGGFLDLDANEKVWVIVAALVGVAIVMMVLTVIYWRHTRPGRGDLQDKRISKAERKDEKAERKEQKRRRKAISKDPFVDGPDDALVPADPDDGPLAAHHPDDGPMDLDALLGEPDPSRSVFGSVEEDPDPGR